MSNRVEETNNFLEECKEYINESYFDDKTSLHLDLLKEIAKSLAVIADALDRED